MKKININKLNIKKVLVVGSLVIIVIGIYVITLDLISSQKAIYALSDIAKNAAEFKLSEIKEMVTEGAKFR